MNKNYLLFACLLGGLFVPGFGQAQNVQNIDAALQRAAAQAQQQYQEDMRNPSILYVAEKRMQLDRDSHGGHATHDLAYYYKQIENEWYTPKTATKPSHKRLKRCIWCGRVETPENSFGHCPADVDVSCYFVEDDPISGRPQAKPDQLAAKAPQDKPLKPVSADVFNKENKRVRVCAQCGRQESPENADGHCPADPDMDCLFYYEEETVSETPLTAEELANATKLVEALKAIGEIDKKVSANDIALVVRATNKQTYFEYLNPVYELQAELAQQYIRDHTNYAEEPAFGDPYSVDEILSVIVFLHEMGK